MTILLRIEVIIQALYFIQCGVNFFDAAFRDQSMPDNLC